MNWTNDDTMRHAINNAATNRQACIILLLYTNHTRRAIARHLNVSETTIRRDITNLTRRMDAA